MVTYRNIKNLKNVLRKGFKIGKRRRVIVVYRKNGDFGIAAIRAKMGSG